jgi:hypothetical protein
VTRDEGKADLGVTECKCSADPSGDLGVTGRKCHADPSADLGVTGRKCHADPSGDLGVTGFNAGFSGDVRVTADKYCIIGAGSSGLTAAKNLLAAGIPFDCLEREDDVGGNWHYGKPASSVYASRIPSTIRRPRQTWMC